MEVASARMYDVWPVETGLRNSLLRKVNCDIFASY